MNHAVASYTYAGEWSLAQTTLQEEQRAIRSSASAGDWYNYTGLSNALAAALHHGRCGRAAYGGVGGGGPGNTAGNSPAAAVCMDSSQAACNAAEQGEYWTADREESATAGASEDAWYGGGGENVAPVGGSRERRRVTVA